MPREPVLKDRLYERHVAGRLDEDGNIKQESLTPDQRRDRADEVLAELEGGISEEEASERYARLREAEQALAESGDNSLTDSPSLWKRFDEDSAAGRQSTSDEVHEWLYGS